MSDKFAAAAGSMYGAISTWLERRLAPILQRMNVVTARQDAVEARVVQLGERLSFWYIGG